MNQREQSAERAAFWQKHHERQQASGVAVNAYCKQQGIGKQSFYQWRRRLQQQALRPTSTVRFAEIKSAARERTPTVALRVRLASGHEVEASGDANTAAIEQILLILLRTEKASK